MRKSARGAEQGNPCTEGVQCGEIGVLWTWRPWDRACGQGRALGTSPGTMPLPPPLLPDILDSAVGGTPVGMGAPHFASSHPPTPDHRLPPFLAGPVKTQPHFSFALDEPITLQI